MSLFKQLSFCLLAAGLLAAAGCRDRKPVPEPQPEPTEPGAAEAQPAVEPVVLKVGHVGHDHHSALFVAIDNCEAIAAKTGVKLVCVEDRKLYELFDGDAKVADMEIVKVGGGSKMPTALAQGVIEIGLGGVAPVLAAVDKGAPLRLVAPLHSKGDMLVVKPDCPANTWAEFTDLIKKAEEPVRVGYKSPVACAKMIFEEALAQAGISFSSDVSATDAKVHMINVKGGGKLNVSLSEGLVDAYVGNNPFPAIGKSKGLLKVICDLEELPPGTFRNHPRCCVAAGTAAMKEKAVAIEALMVMLLEGTRMINTDLDTSIKAVSRWIGTTAEVEKDSMPTSGYGMTPDDAWHGYMATWIKAMDGLGAFTGSLKGVSEPQAAELGYDLSILNKAIKRLEQ